MPRLTAQLIENFAGAYLSPRYDDPHPTPPFHRLGWDLYCSPHPAVELIAPRDHAKSTGFTFDYVLAEVLFRVSDYVLLLGSTEDMAAEQLSNIREELAENEPMRQHFGVRELEQDSKTDIIVKMTDGHRFRILARGAEQKIRGKLWKGKRPNLIVGDDMEDDEQVENKERRAKFRRWFFRAAKQALSQSGKIRLHGTILHEDSLLNRLRKNSQWKHLFFRAHRGFDDFTELLWPERWTETKLRARRQEFIDDGDAPGYSQEFLNEPGDTADPYLRKDDFLPMEAEDYQLAASHQLLFGVGVDFAISKKDHANRTSFTVGGEDTRNRVHVVDERVGRWHTLEIVEEFFSVQKAWEPACFWVEDGQIWKALSPIIYKEMQERGIFLNIVARPAIGDKAARGRAMQKRHRARCMKFDKVASWYIGYEDELLKFRVEAEATLDDQFDSTAHLIAGFEDMAKLEKEDFFTQEEEDFEEESRRLRGRAPVNEGYRRSDGAYESTGY